MMNDTFFEDTNVMMKRTADLIEKTLTGKRIKSVKVGVKVESVSPCGQFDTVEILTEDGDRLIVSGEVGAGCYHCDPDDLGVGIEVELGMEEGESEISSSPPSIDD